MDQRQAQPDGDRGEACGRPPAGRSHDHEHEECGEHHLDHEHGAKARVQHRQFAVAVGAKARRRAADEREHGAGGNRTGALGKDVADRAVGGDAPAGDETEGDRRIEVTA